MPNPPIDFGGETLVVGGIITGATSPGLVQVGSPNQIGMDIGSVLFGYQTANNTSFTVTTMTTAQPVFNISTAGAVTVSGSQTYMMEAMYTLQVATTNSHVYQLGFGGNATVSSIGYQAYVTPNSTTIAVSTAANSVYVSTTALTAVSVASTSSVESVNVFLNGIVTIAGGGTLIPQVALNVGTVPATTVTVFKGSYIGLWPIGKNTIQTVGAWS